MEQPRDLPLELLMTLRADVSTLREETAETRATIRHLVGDTGEVKQDVRRLDDRIFQLMLLQLATLVTALASLATALVTAVSA